MSNCPGCRLFLLSVVVRWRPYLRVATCTIADDGVVDHWRPACRRLEASVVTDGVGQPETLAGSIGRLAFRSVVVEPGSSRADPPASPAPCTRIFRLMILCSSGDSTISFCELDARECTGASCETTFPLGPAGSAHALHATSTVSQTSDLTLLSSGDPTLCSVGSPSTSPWKSTSDHPSPLRNQRLSPKSPTASSQVSMQVGGV